MDEEYLKRVGSVCGGWLFAVDLLSLWNVCALVLGIFARDIEAFLRGASICVTCTFFCKLCRRERR